MMTSASDARRPERARINWWLVSWRAFQVMGASLALVIVAWSSLFAHDHWSCHHPLDAAHIVNGAAFALSCFVAVLGCLFGAIIFVEEAIPAWRRKAGL